MLRSSLLSTLHAIPLTLVAALALPACMEDGESIDSDQLGVTNLDVVDVGYGRTRYVDEVCARRCSRWTNEDYAGGIIRVCYEWYYACGSAAQSVKLFEDDAHLASDVPFEEHPEALYQGCGPKAAQNVLRYYGIDLPVTYIRSIMSTYDFPFSDNIATMPDELARGLEILLNSRGDGEFVVRVHHDKGAQFVKGYLAQGAPAIMLVYGGTHYVVATGFDGSKYHIVDYVDGDGESESRWEYEYELGMDFSPEIPLSSYQSGTVITIEHSAPVCECKPREERVCGAGDVGIQACLDSCEWDICRMPDNRVPEPPRVDLEYGGCSSGTNTFIPSVAKQGSVAVSSFVKQYRIGSGSWTTLTSSTIKAGSKQSVGFRAKACNSNGCGAYAYTSEPGPYCATSRGGILR